MTVMLQPRERLDDLQNGFKIIQNPDFFCYGIDAVLLSWFARVKEGESVLDMGTGCGVIPLLLKAKTKGKHFTGLEIQEPVAEMACRSMLYNQVEEDIAIVTGDIKEASAIFGRASFHVVTCNPPYMTQSHGLINPEEPKAVARHELKCSLRQIIEQAAAVLTSNGRLYLVHRPFRLAEIMRILMEYQLEPKRMQLVYPFADREPNMVLLEAVKGGNPRIQVDKPLIVYETPGVYTRDIREIYGETWTETVQNFKDRN